MNGIKYLLDTCFIIELYNNHAGVLDTIRQRRIELFACAISPINRMEVLGFGNLSEHDSQNLKRLLDHMSALPINQQTENTVIALRKRHKIKLPDAIVLATALNYQLELLSLDQGLMKKYQKEQQN